MLKSTKPLRTIVIGIGKQATSDHIPALLASPMFELVGLVENNATTRLHIKDQYETPVFATLEECLTAFNDIDVAVLCLPHDAYRPCITTLAKHRINIIKEKPFAVSVEEALHYEKLISEYDIQIHVTMQRRFNPIYTSFPQLLRHTGRVYAIEGKYSFNINRLDEGWRSSHKNAGGGALIDMGYHIIDLLVWYFGLPNLISCSTSSGNRLNQAYDVEDTAYVNFCYKTGSNETNKVLGNIIISRVLSPKQEYLHAYGTDGSVRVERGKITRFDTNGSEIESLERSGAWQSAFIDQLEAFAALINNRQTSAVSVYRYDLPIHEHLMHTAIIEACYESARSGRTEDPHMHYNDMLKSVIGNEVSFDTPRI